MHMARLKHVVKRSVELGLVKTCGIISRRLKNHLQDAYWHRKAVKLRTYSTWSGIKRTHAYGSSLNNFLTSLSNPIPFLLEELCIASSAEKWQAESDLLLDNKFKILSDTLLQLPELEWHIDFRLKNTNPERECTFPKAAYYKEIAITPQPGWQLGKDIKIPWELGRLQHLTLLAYEAFECHNEIYYAKIKEHFLDWYTANPPLLGPQWMCPMDVGIRAVNLVWTFFLTEKYRSNDIQFAEACVASLYDHLIYLERNWEIYDYKTSNHYLADLVGYFYVCYFFKDLAGMSARAEWCFKELLSELDKQVFAEGTDYEGSTAYHGLVTEFFYHTYLLAQLFKFEVPSNVQLKIATMVQAIDWWTPANDAPIFIGDEDGGKLLPFGLTKELIDRYVRCTLHEPYKEFKEFGLSIYKDPAIHLTLRHHSYNKRQPSGHFHLDVGSITLNYKGAQLFTDPGSYIYTPSVEWRNLFRSAAMHSTSYLVEQELLQLDDKLFLLSLPDQENEAQALCDTAGWYSCAINRLYSGCGWLHTRSIQFTQAANTIEIIDAWQRMKEEKNATMLGCTFMLGALVEAYVENGTFTLLHAKQPYAVIESEWNLAVEDTWISLGYGSKVSSKKLKAQESIQEKYVQKITRIKLLELNV